MSPAAVGIWQSSASLWVRGCFCIKHCLTLPTDLFCLTKARKAVRQPHHLQSIACPRFITNIEGGNTSSNTDVAVPCPLPPLPRLLQTNPFLYQPLSSGLPTRGTLLLVAYSSHHSPNRAPGEARLSLTPYLLKEEAVLFLCQHRASRALLWTMLTLAVPSCFRHAFEEGFWQKCQMHLQLHM